MPSSRGETVQSRFPPTGDADREAILRYAAEAPLRHGEWKYVKALYKQAERTSEPEILGTLIGRLDAERLDGRAPASGFKIAFPSGTETGDIICAGTTLYAASAPGRSLVPSRGGSDSGRRSSGSLCSIDLSQPVEPQPIGSTGVRDIRALAADGELLFAAGSGLRVLDVSEPRRPRPIGHLEAGSLHRIAVAGRTVYCLVEDTETPGGLLVVDVSDPTRPARTAFLEIPGARDLAVVGTRAYVVAGSRRQGWLGLRHTGGLSVIDVSDPRSPRVAGQATVVGGQAIAVSGSYAYVCARDERRRVSTLHVFHLFTPVTPRLAGSAMLGMSWRMEGTRWNLAVRGANVFVASHSSGVRLVNAANPTHPVPAAIYPVYATAGIALFDSVLCAVGQLGDLSVLDITDPARPMLLGNPPSNDTLRYMKRRARRHLRRLAREDPELYVRAACHALMTAGRLQSELDPAHQWISIELLYGGSGRYAQASHGEGPCYARWHHRFLRRREELAPDAWDRRPGLVQRLLATPNLPWQTRDMALKMLRSQRVALPALPPAALASMLRSPSPLLVVTAARDAVRQMLSGGDFEPEVAAAAFFAANGRTRKEWTERWSDWSKSTDWQASFAASLGSLIGERSGQGVFSRRVIAAAALLGHHFADSVAGDALLPTAVALLGSDQQQLQALAASLIARLSPTTMPVWMAALAQLPEARRYHALERLLAAVPGREIDRATAQRLVFASAAWEREAGWRLLAALPVPATVAAALWNEMLVAEGLPPALRTALYSPAALETLRTARLVSSDLDARLAQRALRAELLTPVLLADLVRVAPVGLLVRMLADAGEADWERLRDPLVEALEKAGRLTAFWQAVWPAVAEDPASALNRRLLQDSRMADTFLEVEGTEFLESRYPPAAGLLLRWLEWRRERFPRDSLELLAAATAPLPAVREWGLQRVAVVGMELPFALRLIESGLPGSVEAGRVFFEAPPLGASEALEYGLALCDSPEPAVRAYGREYVLRRWDRLPQAELIGQLAEHSDPVMQEFVARLISDHPQVCTAPGEFDRAVLRATDRGRRAKELVKRRREHPSPEEIPLLLEIARGRTGRDAEWAWMQLARLALDGHEVEGFRLEGTAGV
jgi:hypothetical protein